jgi:hypothetical protein
MRMAAGVQSTRAVADCNLDGSRLHGPTDLFIWRGFAASFGSQESAGRSGTRASQRTRFTPLLSARLASGAARALTEAGSTAS